MGCHPKAIDELIFFRGVGIPLTSVLFCPFGYLDAVFVKNDLSSMQFKPSSQRLGTSALGASILVDSSTGCTHFNIFTMCEL